MAYSKKYNSPSLKKPGVYPPGTDKELGLDNDDLEKFSLGNWNSIVKDKRKFFIAEQDDSLFVEDLYESGIYLGRPVRVRLVDNPSDPILTWTLVKRVGGFTYSSNQTGDSGVLGLFADTWNGGYDSDIIEQDYTPGDTPISVNFIPEQQWYADTTIWQERARWNISDSARVGPLMPLSRFVANYETDEVKRMFKFYRTFHRTYKRSDEDTYVDTEIPSNSSLGGPDNFSLAVREQIVEIFTEKYNDLKNIIDGEIGYIKEQDINDPYLQDAEEFSIPIQLTFKTDIQSQIDEILSFNVEVYGDGRGSGIQDNAGVYYTGDTLPAGTIGLSGHWYHRFKLYFGSYNYTLDSQIKGYSSYDDNNRPVGNLYDWGEYPQVTETYLPEDSYVLSDESPIEYWGGIYFEKLTDDGSIIKIGDVVGDGIYSGFTNTGRAGGGDRFYFGLTYAPLLELFSADFQNKLQSIGHPFYNFNYIEDITFGGVEQVDYDTYGNPIVIDEIDYEVQCTRENSDINFLYHGVGDEYDETSYPVKIELNMGLYGITFNQETSLINYSTLDALYLGELVTLADNYHPENGVYRYSVIQWGDEKNLLTDDQILNSEYFYLYTTEPIPTPDSYFYKRVIQNKSSQLNFSLGSFHVYNTPGVKTIKIIAYRYDLTGNILLQTTLVTKNIVVNDGTLLSQDFSIFGGTDFNFLPLSNKEAIIGGLDEDSKYNNSVEKIKKDDNFIIEDYLERASSRNFIDNFNKGLYGESPGQLDLSTTRVFKKPLDIYDFITDDKQLIVHHNFNISEITSSLPINSSATDIFISNNDCIVDLNPQDIEYLSIQNKTGTADKTVLIGDYKVNQPKDGRVQREGVMQTPLLEKNTDKQAF